MKNVLLLVNLNTHLTEQLRLARLLRSSGRYHPIIYFTRDYPGLAQDVQQCQAEGLAVLGLRQLSLPQSSSDSSEMTVQKIEAEKSLLQRLALSVKEWGSKESHALWERALLFTYDRIAKHVLIVPIYLLRYRSLLKGHRQCLKQHQIDLLVLPVAGISYDAHVWVKAAGQVAVPQVVIPFNYGQNMAVYMHRTRLSMKRVYNRIAAYFYPQWVVHSQGQRAMRLYGPEVAAIQWLKMAPPNPLLLYSSRADAMILGSQAMWDYYASLGMDTAQFVLTGDLFNDTLAAILQDAPAQREALYAQLGLPPGKPLLLCSLPPNQLSTADVRSDFASYEALLRFWVETLQQFDNYNLVLNLHPRITAQERTFIRTLGAAIAPQDTPQVIPMANLYVACVSSVIRLAVACGIPVVNYDVYRYDYDIYSDIPGVVEMQEQADFEETLRRLTQEPAYYAQVKAQQESVMEYWGKLDGKAGERMLALFDRLTGEGQS